MSYCIISAVIDTAQWCNISRSVWPTRQQFSFLIYKTMNNAPLDMVQWCWRVAFLVSSSESVRRSVMACAKDRLPTCDPSVAPSWKAVDHFCGRHPTHKAQHHHWVSLPLLPVPRICGDLELSSSLDLQGRHPLNIREGLYTVFLIKFYGPHTQI